MPRRSRQKEFVLGVEIFEPLIGLETARGMLRLNADTITDMIPDQLAWGWDIGLGEHRKEVRLLTQCVKGFQVTKTSCNMADRREEEIIAGILCREPHPFILGVHFMAIFSCENKLMLELARTELEVLPGSDIKPGPGGSPKLTRGSVVEFLKRRRIV